MKVHTVDKSGNAKTGPIPVTTSGAQTCPTSCGLRDVCYAKSGPLAMHWRAVTAGERGETWSRFLAWVRALPSGAPWRHNQAGDLPGVGNRIAAGKLAQLADAAAHTRGWTYTHKPLTDANVRAIDAFNAVEGMTVNVSVDRASDVDAPMGRGLPTVAMLPFDAPRVTRSPGGRRIVACPATYRSDVQCASCGDGQPLCQRRERSYAIGFPAHGTRARAASDIAGGAK